MQASAQIVDPNLTYEQLANLGSKLKLPAGWKFRVTVLDRDLNIKAINGDAWIVQDDLENTYDKCFEEAGQTRLLVQAVGIGCTCVSQGRVLSCPATSRRRGTRGSNGNCLLPEVGLMKLVNNTILLRTSLATPTIASVGLQQLSTITQMARSEGICDQWQTLR